MPEEPFLDDLNKSFEGEEFLHDFGSFLSHAAKHKIRLTPKRRFLPMKHIYAINALLRNPLQLDHKVGDKIYKTREEWSARRIYFIDLLAEASECIVPDEKDVLVPGPEYDRFLNMNGFAKKRWLVFAWWFHLDWSIWFPQGDFGQTLQAKCPEIVPYLKEWAENRGMINSNKSAKTLIKDLALKWNAPSQQFANMSMKWGIQRCILLPLTYFDIIEPCYEKEDKYGIKEIKGFYLKPMGRIFLSELVRIGEHIESRTRR